MNNLTKRELYAALALQGALAGNPWQEGEHINSHAERCALLAIRATDALMGRLKENGAQRHPGSRATPLEEP